MRKELLNLHNISKKFLSPLKLDKELYFKGLFSYGLLAINPIVHIIFIQKVTDILDVSDYIRFKKLILFYIIYVIIYEILEIYSRNWSWVKIAEKTQKNLHNIYIKDFIKLDNTETEKIGAGTTLSIIDKGLYRWGYLIDMLIAYGISIIFNVIFTIYTLSKLGILYAILFLIIYLTVCIFVIFVNKIINNERRLIVDEKTKYTNQILSIIMGKFDILKNGIISKEIGLLDNNIDKIIGYNKKISPYNLLIKRLPIFLLGIFELLVILYVGDKIINKEIHISYLILLLGTITLVNKSIYDFLNLYKNFAMHFHTIDKLWKFFDKTKLIKGYNNKNEFIYKKGDILIKNLDFSYTKRRTLFQNLNLDIYGGKITAIVGGKGSGKKTLSKLILKYITPDNGEIFIDGQNLNNISLKSYYKNISYLSSNPFFSNVSIYDNLLNFLPKIEEQESNLIKINKALKLANCDFVNKLPDGIFTLIGDNNIELTIGEKERLAIARVFLKNPNILIIDEFSAPLDLENENLTNNAIVNLIKGRTVIIIAHKLSTLKFADEIIIIENGSILERGSHNELLNNNNIYSKLIKLECGF
ncbi:MAG: ABC transporter ATP-binding protein [Candidatus Gracilibacteria bacterium]|nr:ABC transporter ATP-binding protein [Candidatus Gracilibacteria bacterium]